MVSEDYRRKDARPLSSASTFIIREIQQKQAWLKALYIENNEAPSGLVGRFSTASDPAEVADDIIKELGITPSNYNTTNPIKAWIDKAEAKGILVSRTSFIHSRLKLDSDELQGFAIADKFAPFVFVNSDHWDAPQLFTLVHELAHVWIAASGISSDIEPAFSYSDKCIPLSYFATP